MRSPARFCPLPWPWPLLLLLPILTLWPAAAARAQTSGGKKGVQITFLPPPLENASFSLGIYDAKSGRLVRRLQEGASESVFTVGLNGLITRWDGKDDAGKPVPPGRYAARGYGVAPLKVEGEDIEGNDWAAEDENLRIKHVDAIALAPADGGLVVLATLAGNRHGLLRFSGGKDFELLWQTPVKLAEPAAVAASSLYADSERVYLPGAGPGGSDTAPGYRTCRLSDGKEEQAPRVTPLVTVPSESDGKDGTRWFARGKDGLTQESRTESTLRHLEAKADEPLPQAVSASTTTDRLYLLEEKPGWQRVRGLAWVEAKEEDGHPTSTWQTFFERNIRTTPDAGAPAGGGVVEISLAENPLNPGKPQKLRLTASFDAKGSYLATEGGLRLRRISERANLESARVARGKTPGGLTFVQSDGAATDEFSIAGTRNIMEFDAGEFEMSADGEKPNETKAAEPPDL